jgi:hypothetical protein
LSKNDPLPAEYAMFLYDSEDNDGRFGDPDDVKYFPLDKLDDARAAFAVATSKWRRVELMKYDGGEYDDFDMVDEYQVDPPLSFSVSLVSLILPHFRLSQSHPALVQAVLLPTRRLGLSPNPLAVAAQNQVSSLKSPKGTARQLFAQIAAAISRRLATVWL